MRDAPKRDGERKKKLLFPLIQVTLGVNEHCHLNENLLEGSSWLGGIWIGEKQITSTKVSVTIMYCQCHVKLRGSPQWTWNLQISVYLLSTHFLCTKSILCLFHFQQHINCKIGSEINIYEIHIFFYPFHWSCSSPINSFFVKFKYCTYLVFFLSHQK